MSNPLGGGGGGSSSQATNATTVNVATNFTVDTAGVQAAINALAGETSAAQLAVAGALVGSSAQTAAALQGLGKALGQGLAAIGSGNDRTQIIIAGIGLVGVLIAARVIKFKKLKVQL